MHWNDATSIVNEISYNDEVAKRTTYVMEQWRKAVWRELCSKLDEKFIKYAGWEDEIEKIYEDFENRDEEIDDETRDSLRIWIDIPLYPTEAYKEVYKRVDYHVCVSIGDKIKEEIRNSDFKFEKLSISCNRNSIRYKENKNSDNYNKYAFYNFICELFEKPFSYGGEIDDFFNYDYFQYLIKKYLVEIFKVFLYNENEFEDNFDFYGWKKFINFIYENLTEEEAKAKVKELMIELVKEYEKEVEKYEED